MAASAQTISPTLVQLTAGDPIEPVQFSVVGGTTRTIWSNSTTTPLPGNLVLSRGGVLSGTPSAPGNRTFTILSSNPGGRAEVTLAIAPNAPTIVSPADRTHLGNGTLGLTDSPFRISATGGVAPYQWTARISRIDPAPPTDSPRSSVSITPFDGSSADLSGNFTTVGNYTITIQASGNNTIRQRSAAVNYTIQIVRNTPTIVSPPTGTFLGNATVGLPFGPIEIEGSGGVTPYTWRHTSSGAPATEIQLEANGNTTANLTGNFTSPGNVTVNVVARGNNGVSSRTSVYTIRVLAVPQPVLTPSSGFLPNGTAFVPYGPVSFQVSGGTPPYTWTAELTSPANGSNIEITPQGDDGASAMLTGSFPLGATYGVRVSVSDSHSGGSQTKSGNFQIRIAEAGPPPLPATARLPVAVIGVPYPAYTFNATGGVMPLTWVGLPNPPAAGLTLSENGVLSGTPAELQDISYPQTIPLSITATDVLTRTGSTNSTLVIVRPLAVSGPDAITGTRYQSIDPQPFTATGGFGNPTWSTSPRLPSTLSINATTGVISGNLSADPGDYTVAVIARDAESDQTASQNLTISILPLEGMEWVTESELPGGKVATPYSANLSVTGGRPPYSFAVKQGSSLPTWLTLNATTGRLAGTPTLEGNYSFTVVARDSANPQSSAERTFTLAIDPYGMTVDGPDTITGRRYESIVPALFTVNGGTANYTWSASPRLPASLTINSSTGQISGNPTAAPGNYVVTVVVRDGRNQRASKNCTVTILPLESMEWVTASELPGGKVGIPYSGNLAVTGGKPAYNFTVKRGSATPPGLRLASNGTLSGTPSQEGNYSFTVTARDSDRPAQTIERTFTLAIEPYGMTVDGPDTIVGRRYESIAPALFTVIGGTANYTWSTTPRLPASLTINSSTGEISGNLTAAPRTYAVTVVVRDGRNQRALKNLTVTILPLDPMEWNTDSELPGGKVGTPYSANLSVTGGKPSYTFTVKRGSATPPGLQLASNGTLSGTPSQEGNYSFTVTARDSERPAQTIERTFTLAIEPYGMTVDGPDTMVGRRYESITPAPFTVNGGTANYTWSTTPRLPASLTINSSTGEISGNLTAAPGNYTIAVTVKDSANQTATRNCTVTILPPPPLEWITESELPGGKVGTPYSANLTVTGGNPSFTFIVKRGSATPPGLRLASNGTLSGTPSQEGNYSFTVTARDSDRPAQTIERTFTLAIEPYGMTVDGPDTMVGRQYESITPAPFTVNGGTANYTWSTTPRLPASLTINSSTGEISGNLTAAPRTYSVTVAVRDGRNQRASKNCTITILPPAPLAILTPPDLGLVATATDFQTQMEAKGGRPGYRWTFASRGNLPANANLATNGTLTVNSTTALTANFTVRVTDANSANTTKDMTLRFVESDNVTDSDKDGVNDYRELYDGTDPMDPTSFNPLSIGLVAHYPFTGNARDESGYENDGIVQGAVLAADQFGNPDNAYEFDGLSSSIEVSDSESLRPPKQISVSAWMNLDGLQNYRRILTKGVEINDSFGSYQLITGSNLNDHFHDEPLFTIQTTNGYRVPDPKNGQPVQQWIHVLGTYDGEKSRLFYNGKLVAEVESSGDLRYDSNPLMIGRDLFYNVSFVGKIDEVRIYNRALSAAEVAQLYSEESGEPNMVLVQGGALPEGSELAGQTVSAFHIARFETTWAEWKQVRTWAIANGYDIGDVGEGSADNHPVRAVNWYDAVKWCNAKSEMDGLIPVYTANGTVFRAGDFAFPERNLLANGYRLPTETEWEWSARGGALSQGFNYSGSNDLEDVGWYFGNSNNSIVNLHDGRGTWPAGSKAPNELGIFDMSGNVWEWCEDLNNEPLETYHRSIRGGNWSSGRNGVGQGLIECEVDTRGRLFPWSRFLDLPQGENSHGSTGFRYARNAIGDMVTVQGGTLPASSELAGQKVQAFQIGRTEVTWDEWQTVRDWAVANGYTDLAGVGIGTDINHPVQQVNWYDVIKWSNALSEREGLIPVYSVNGTIFKTGEFIPSTNPVANGYRLPTEAEWEWAARGGLNSQGYIYSGSNDVNSVAWYLGNSGDGTRSVSTKAANESGIYDMSGNVYEWVWDEYSSPDGYSRRLRGGAWSYEESSAKTLERYYGLPWSRTVWNGTAAHGFRLARNIGPKISITGELPEAVLNQPYADFTFGVSGTNAPVVWSISEGTLPPGMSFDPATATLTGTPTQAGLYTFVLRVESGGYWDEVEVELEVVVGGVVDSDGDGVNDYRELYDGTDPMDPTSFNPLSIGLIAHYPFDGNPKDESGYGKNGKIVGTVLPSPDRFGETNKSYLFDGATGSIAAVDSSLTTAEDNVTLVTWIKATEEEILGTEATSGTSYIHKYVVGGGGNHGGFLLGAGTNGISVLEHAFQYMPVVLSYPAPLGSEWVQIAITSSNNEAPLLYINGKHVRTGLSSGRKKILRAFSPEEDTGIGGGPYGRFKGNIDEVRIYNRALSAAEVSQLYSEESGEPNMVLVQGGTLPEGSELVGQTVSAFHIARFETTWAEWKQVRTWAADNGYDIGAAGQGSADNHPVRNISWYDVVKWCNAKSEMEGLMPVYSVNGSTYKTGEATPIFQVTANGYRLPVEAEWEWAASGGAKSQGYPYSGSSSLSEVAWFQENSTEPLQKIFADRGTWPVGSKAFNELGLYDASGNLWEWTWDASGNYRRFRGGSFNSTPNHCEVKDRSGYALPNSNHNGRVGFRYGRNAIGDMVTVQGGTLPETSELAGQTVQTFQIGRTEVTWDEWQAVRNWAIANGYTDLTGVGNGTSGKHPVRNVSWYDVVKWCNAKSEMMGLSPVYMLSGAIFKTGESVPNSNPTANGFRLPAEVEWEWVARGGISSQGFTYSGSNDVKDVAWYLSNSGGGTQSVGIKAANELGVHDMSGNVWEWVFDSTEGNKNVRGGSWNLDEVVSRVNVYGGNTNPLDRNDAIGFRLARNIGPKISITGELPEALLNQPYAGFTFGVSGTNALVAWSISEGTLPPGMSFSATGTLAGTPTQVGLYTFVLRAESGGYWDEVEVELEVSQSPNNEFVYVSGGNLPSSSVFPNEPVASFEIGKHEVTWELWKEVRDWAAANGYYDFLHENVGNGVVLSDYSWYQDPISLETINNWSEWYEPENSPVFNVGWQDVILWCNARSEKEGLRPVYTMHGKVLRQRVRDSDLEFSGHQFYILNEITADFSANGFRLPTAKEWTWAAYGGNLSKNYTFIGGNNLDDVAVHTPMSMGSDPIFNSYIFYRWKNVPEYWINHPDWWSWNQWMNNWSYIGEIDMQYNNNIPMSSIKVLEMLGWYKRDSAGGFNFDDTNLVSNRGAWPIGMKTPNELGLYDMAGNLEEWSSQGDLLGGNWAETYDDSNSYTYSANNGYDYLKGYKSNYYGSLWPDNGYEYYYRKPTIGFRLARKSAAD